MSLAEDLYERDFYAWALEQADVLRRREAGANALDYENLAEEVEGLARAVLSSCKSWLRLIVEHSMKISAASEAESALAHWRKEITTFRGQIDADLTPSLRFRFEAEAARVIEREIRSWRQVDRALATAWEADPPTVAECLDEDWFPQPGARTLRSDEAV